LKDNEKVKHINDQTQYFFRIKFEVHISKRFHQLKDIIEIYFRVKESEVIKSLNSGKLFTQKTQTINPAD